MNFLARLFHLFIHWPQSTIHNSKWSIAWDYPVSNPTEWSLSFILEDSRQLRNIVKPCTKDYPATIWALVHPSIRMALNLPRNDLLVLETIPRCSVLKLSNNHNSEKWCFGLIVSSIFIACSNSRWWYMWTEMHCRRYLHTDMVGYVTNQWCFSASYKTILKRYDTA